MQQIKLHSDEARNSWGQTVDNAIAGREVIVTRYNRPVASLVNHDWLQEMKRRLAELEQQQRSEYFAREFAEMEKEDLPTYTREELNAIVNETTAAE